MRSSRTRLSGLAAMVGGALWVPYGIFEMQEPWGADVAYRDDVGYSLITDASLFLTYSMPGGLAVLLTSLGLLDVFARLGASAGLIDRIGTILTYIAVVLAVLSVAGVIALFDPLFTVGRVFGTLALGTATFLAGVGALRSRMDQGWTAALLCLGIAGIFLFPLWPLVYALQWVPQAAGAAYMVLFGLGWTVLGYRMLRSEKGEELRQPARVR